MQKNRSPHTHHKGDTKIPYQKECRVYSSNPQKLILLCLEGLKRHKIHSLSSLKHFIFNLRSVRVEKYKNAPCIVVPRKGKKSPLIEIVRYKRAPMSVKVRNRLKIDISDLKIEEGLQDICGLVAWIENDAIHIKRA